MIALSMLIYTPTNDAIAQQIHVHRDTQPRVRDHRDLVSNETGINYRRLRDLLRNEAWEEDRVYTWKLML